MSAPEDDALARELEARARALSQPVAPLVPVRRAALRLAIGTDRVLLASERARAVVPLARVTPIPFTEPHVAGLAARRGRAIPVFHLRVLLGLPLSDLPETSRAVVLDTPGEPALAVDGVEDAELPLDEALRPAPETMTASARGWVRGTTEDGQLVLDVDALLASARLTIDVGPRGPRRV